MPTLLFSFRLPVPPAPTVPALMIVAPARRVSSWWWVWPTRKRSGLARFSCVELLEGVGEQRGVVDHHDVDVVAERPQPGREALDLRLVGLLEDVREVFAGAALVRVVVARHPDPLDLHDRVAGGPARAPSSRPVRVRTIAPSRASRFASWSESWLPGTNTNGLPVLMTRLTTAGLDRAAAVGQVAGEEDGTLGGGPLEDRDRDDVVVEVRCEREARAVLERGAVAGGGDEAREADELGVELLVERPRAALGGLDRARARAGCRGRRRSTAGRRSGRAAGGR